MSVTPLHPHRPVALVTGASSGIGLASATTLAHAGFAVVGTSRDPAGATSPEGVELLGLDVARDESVQRVVDEVIERFGRIDVLVNNAGVGLTGAAEESTAGQAQLVFDINVFGVMRMTNAVLPHMRSQGHGRIINVSSILGLIPAPYMALYAATKHAVEGYSESLDHEVREYGVRVLLVEPGYTSTGFETNAIVPDRTLPAYAAQRLVAGEVFTEAMVDADSPATVAEVILAAATDSKPKLRYPAGSIAGRVSVLRRAVPSRAFDKQIRKLNRLIG